MANTPKPTTLLGEQIDKRLKQLGLSRRELCKRIHLSRQTLNHLEHDPERGFILSTFDAIDEGLRWPKGTAESFHKGIPLMNADSPTTEERVRSYVGSILAHILAMDIEQLEREVLMLEEESMGRGIATDEEALKTIGATVERLTNALLNGRMNKGGR